MGSPLQSREASPAAASAASRPGAGSQSKCPKGTSPPPASHTVSSPPQAHPDQLRDVRVLEGMCRACAVDFWPPGSRPLEPPLPGQLPEQDSQRGHRAGTESPRVLQGKREGELVRLPEDAPQPGVHWGSHATGCSSEPCAAPPGVRAWLLLPRRRQASVWSWPVCLVARLGGVNTEPGPRGCSVGERASPLRGGRRSGPGDGPLFLSCTGLVSATLPVSSAGEEGGAAGHTGGPGGLCGTGLAMGVGPRSPREPRAAPSWLALRRPRGPGLPTSRRSETPQLPAGTETRPRPPAALPGRLHGVSAVSAGSFREAGTSADRPRASHSGGRRRRQKRTANVLCLRIVTLGAWGVQRLLSGW